MPNPTKDSSPSTWAPLRRGDFRSLWIGSLSANVALWAQNAVGSWDMTSLSTSPVDVALLQTMAGAPVLLVGHSWGGPIVRLAAENRTDAGKGAARRLRAAGRIPAVLYGQGGEAVVDESLDDVGDLAIDDAEVVQKLLDPLVEHLTPPS